MLTTTNQRWRDRRDSYRPTGEPIRTRDYEVATLPTDNVAKAFIHQHHYSGTYPAARYRFGLYRAKSLVGVAVFSVPAQPRCLDVLPCAREEAVDFGRFVLLDDVPSNGESWFLARCHELLVREGLRGVVTFADPVPRTKVTGEVVFTGHIGTIYQATNAVYVGKSAARVARLLPDGRVLHERGLVKIRKRERGWRHVAAVLETFGASPLRESDDARAWVEHWAKQLTRPLRHTGNHKYLWGLTSAEKRHMPAGLPYPKMAVRA